ncbi:MAG: twin-arginine translocase subunit TatC [Armatimonadia bacterium]|nr:twin-arginine translocase subunit TatC [Armatimonadia bacterium]
MADDRKELSFWDHLEELRWRILRMGIYVIVAAAASWIFREQMLDVLRLPAETGAAMAGIEDFEFRIFEAAGGFILMMQIALVAGLILAAPGAFIEMWLFVEPALEKHERKWVILVIPLATALFLGGVIFCYWISPKAFAFFFRFNQSMGVEVELTLTPYLFFLMRLLLVFGVAFELPLVLTFLSAVGIVTQAQLLSWWRHAVLVIFIFAAIATPTTDPATMSFMAGPMVVLYLISVWLAGIFEKRRERGEAVEEPDADE